MSGRMWNQTAMDGGSKVPRDVEVLLITTYVNDLDTGRQGTLQITSMWETW